MNVTTLLTAIAIIGVGWGTVTSIRILDALRKRGHSVNFFLLRLYLPSYVHRYAVLTKEETGKTGPLLYHFVIAFNVALVAVLVLALLKHM